MGKMERNVFYGEDSPEDNHELADIFEALSNDDRPRPEDRVEGKEIKNLMSRKVLDDIHIICKKSLTWNDRCLFN